MAVNPWDQDEVVRPSSNTATLLPTVSPAASTLVPATATTSVLSPAVANPWDGDEVVRGASGASTGPASSTSGTAAKPTLSEQAVRGFGIGSRGLVQGLVDLPAMVSDNLISKPLNAAADLVAGKGNGPRLKMAGESTDDLLSRAGLPEAQTSGERVVQSINRGAAGAVSTMGAGAALTTGARAGVAAAQIPQTVGKAVGTQLLEAPALQVTSGATSGAASSVVSENGGGELAQFAAGLAGGLAPVGVARKAVDVPQLSQAAKAAKAAHKAGYVIPPSDVAPTMLSEALNGIGGKIKTAQFASARNQSVSNDMARKALGLGADTELTIDALESVRRNAAAAYAPVAASGRVIPTASFSKALDKAIDPFISQSKSFPGMKVPGVVDDINALRSPQFDAGDALNAIRTMREGADKAFRAGEASSGKAYRQAASALEDALETHLQGLGQNGTQILEGFRGARQQIAKSYSVQGALNPQTGAVNAIKLAADLAKGKPISGELRTVAEFGQAFPKAAQALKESPKSGSVFDSLATLGTGIATGSPLSIGLLAARPAARSVLLSKRVQKRMANAAGTQSKLQAEAMPAIALNSIAQSGDGKPEIYSNRVKAGADARRLGKRVYPEQGGWVVR